MRGAAGAGGFASRYSRKSPKPKLFPGGWYTNWKNGFGCRAAWHAVVGARGMGGGGAPSRPRMPLSMATQSLVYPLPSPLLSNDHGMS